MRTVVTSKDLIEKHFTVIDGERLLRDNNFMQINLHQFRENTP